MSGATGYSQESQNPLGTDGFEFVEYTAEDPELLRTLFERLGFPATAKHRSKNVTLHQQGDINFIINAEPDSFAQRLVPKYRSHLTDASVQVLLGAKDLSYKSFRVTAKHLCTLAER